VFLLTDIFGLNRGEQFWIDISESMILGEHGFPVEKSVKNEKLDWD
jgi:hypothetical protein